MGSMERFLAHAGLAWCCLTTPSRAEEVPQSPPPPTRAQCLEHHERAQDARLSGQLLAARSALRECGAGSCPGLVTRDCVAWLAEVEAQLPSVIFRGVKDGNDVVALRVREGDRLLTETITGTPLELDPGPHHFVAELPGFPPERVTYVLHAGDKGRVVRFDFTSTPAAVAAASSSAKARAPVVEPAPLARPIPALTYALAGSALGAAVTGTVLGLLALSERHDAENRCAPLCQDRELVAVRNLALASDIALGLALLAAGGAAYGYVTRPSVSALETASRTARSRLHLSWTGLGVVARGNF